MESGVVDTVAFAQHAHLSFRTVDIATWWTENLNPGTVNCPVVVNTDAYNDLPEEHRAALDESVDEAIAYYLENYAKLIEKWDAILAEKGVQRITIADEELAKFREVAAGPVREAWLADMSAQGLPAQELLDLVNETLEKKRMAN
jgi:TRAP-type C4-dicarboxylate transport system substrate-binding protein